MLYDDPVLYYRGLTIYKDFSNPDTYYFKPPDSGPRIARSSEGGNKLAMRLVIFRPDLEGPLPEGMEDGGGFLNLDVDLQVSEELLEEVTEKVREEFGGNANLVPVPYMDGSVELILLGTSRDDEDEPFVRKIAGSTKPSLYGSQRAAFSVVLDRNGAALMKQVIEEGGATMALAIYHLKYAGIGPAYNLKITIDYERVYEKLDLDLKASVSAGNSNSKFVGKAGFHMLMEKLKEDRAIIVEETDPIPGENGRTLSNQEQINEIISNLMGSKWFKPSMSSVGQMANLARSSSSGSSSSSSSRTGGSSSSSSRTGGSSSSSSSSTPRSSSNTSGSTTSSASSSTPTRQAARLTKDRSQMHEACRELDIDTFTPSTSGNDERLVINGEGFTVKTGPSATDLHDHQVIGNTTAPISVPPGQTTHFEIRWPSVAGDISGFHLFFDYDRPRNPTEISSYTNWDPEPDEPDSSTAHSSFPGEQDRFLAESRAADSGSQRNRTALETWLNSLSDTALTLKSHASFERNTGRRTDAQRTTHNQALSERRMQVARNVIPRRFNTDANQSLGDTVARPGGETIVTLAGDNAPANGRGGRPQDRVVIIEGKRNSRPECILKGHINRPATPTTPPGTTPPGTTPPGRTPPSTTPQEQDPTKVEASFEVNLEMIEREEKITASYELNSRKARTHEIHPQGQLMLDVPDPSEYILEADLAIDFFKKLQIKASTTAQWQLDGIDSINVELRYAPDGRGGFQQSQEIHLKPDQEEGSWSLFVLHENEDDSMPVVYWYEYRVTLHFLSNVALGDQQGAVTSKGVEGADAEGWIRTTTRNLVIHPRDVTPAITLNIATGIMRYDLMNLANLTLNYGPYVQNIKLTSEAPDHRLVIRPEEGLEDQKILTTGTLFYKDGAQIELPETEWSLQELAVINEPRDQILRVQVVMADPGKQFDKIVATLKYDQNNRVVEEEFEFTEHAQIKDWAVRLEDPALNQWQYKLLILKKSGDIDSVDWQDGPESNLLILGVEAKEIIPVHVTWLMPPPMGDLLAVKIDMEYIDEDNDIHWKHAELIRAGHPGDFIWKIFINDIKKTTYRYRVTEFRAAGPSQGEWQENNTTELVLLPGF